MASRSVGVVEEAVVGGGAVAEPGLREELKERGGHDVRGGVADDAERISVRLFEEPEGDVFVQRGGEVDEAFGGGWLGGVHGLFGGSGIGGRGGVCRSGGERTDAGDDDGGSKTRRDAVGDVKRRGAGRDLADGAVRELDV